MPVEGCTKGGAMRKLETVASLRREEALILAWIGEVTRDKQARLIEIRRRLGRISRAEWEKRVSAKSAQGAVNKGVALRAAE